MSGSACCQGFIDSGTPTGTETEIGKIACYVADHSSHPKTAIVVLTDIFGFRTPNPRLIADGLAETCECQVYVPDLFDGKEVAGSLMTNMEVATGPDSSILSKIGSYLGAASSFVPFMLRNRISVSLDRTKIVIQELRSSGVDTILLVGYCWGGKLGCLLASNKSIDEKYPKLVQAVFCAHPGFFSVPHDIHNIATEFEFLFAEKDFEISSKQMQKVRELVAAMPKKIDLHYYPNTAHGFAVRGNEKDPIVKAARDDAFRKASAFLKRFVV